MAVSAYQSEIDVASQKYGVPASIIAGIIQNESGGQNTPGIGNGGGLGQFTPSTWNSLGGGNVNDAQTNISHIAQYLNQLNATTHSWPLAVGSYYAGPSSVMAHKSNLNYIPSPQSGNSLTVQEYINHALGSSAVNTSYTPLASNTSLTSGMLSGIGSAVVNPILRAGFIGLGVVLVIIGGYLMISPTEEQKAKIAKLAVPEAKVIHKTASTEGEK